jgi:MFS family permease
MGDAVTNQTKKGWLTAILELGAWFGALYSGLLCERISRKYTILANVGVFCIGVVIQTTAATKGGNSSHILGGRFITGMGVGRCVYFSMKTYIQIAGANNAAF